MEIIGHYLLMTVTFFHKLSFKKSIHFDKCQILFNDNKLNLLEREKVKAGS